MLSELARFEPFHAYGPSELKQLVVHATHLDVPAGRWLLRKGRRLSGHHYLLRGSLLTRLPDGVVEAGTAAAVRPVHPGPKALRTLTDCRLLRISEAGLALAGMHLDADLITVTEAEACWQTRFLESHLMTALRPVTWQRVLSRLQAVPVPAGAWVLREGAPPDGHCCILAAGRCQVSREGVSVAVLEAGDLFGEDALIAGGCRNASVRMVAPGVVMYLAAVDFSRFLVEVLEEGGFHEPLVAGDSTRTLLRVVSDRNLRERIARLDRSVTYLVSSPSDALLALTLFLLRKHGHAAWAAGG